MRTLTLHIRELIKQFRSPDQFPSQELINLAYGELAVIDAKYGMREKEHETKATKNFMSALDKITSFSNNSENYEECELKDAAKGELIALREENEHLIKEIAWEKANRQLCEEHLIGMVMQYCRNFIYLDENKNTENTFSHDFMSAGEGAFGYLTARGLAKYCDNFIDIYFDKEEDFNENTR